MSLTKYAADLGRAIAGKVRSPKLAQFQWLSRQRGLFGEAKNLNGYDCLIHFHLLRTRGTWLRQSLIPHLLKIYGPDQIFHVNGPSEWGCGYGPYEKLANLDRRARSRLRFISGHMPTGVLDLFDNAFSCTIIREPTDRALSDYWYCYHAKDNPAHPHARRLTPGEFCRAGYGQSRNGQARYLADVVYSGEQLSDAELLARAERTLARFNLIGIDHDIGPFLDGLRAVGISDLEMTGRTNAAPRMTEASPADIEIIKACSWVDYALYDRVMSSTKRALPGQ